jgi:hypothetical protein
LNFDANLCFALLASLRTAIFAKFKKTTNWSFSPKGLKLENLRVKAVLEFVLADNPLLRTNANLSESARAVLEGEISAENFFRNKLAEEKCKRENLELCNGTARTSYSKEAKKKI